MKDLIRCKTSMPQLVTKFQLSRWSTVDLQPRAQYIFRNLKKQTRISMPQLELKYCQEAFQSVKPYKMQSFTNLPSIGLVRVWQKLTFQKNQIYPHTNQARSIYGLRQHLRFKNLSMVKEICHKNQKSHSHISHQNMGIIRDQGYPNCLKIINPCNNGTKGHPQ